MEISAEYFTIVAKQLVLISVFLGGVSVTILGTMIIHENESKVFKFMILGLSLAALSFIVSIFGITEVQMILAPDSPYGNKKEALFYPKVVGGLSFAIGIFSLITVIGASGWLKSKSIGIFTTVIAIISGILIFTLM